MAKKKKQKGVSMTAFAALTTYSDLLSLLLTLFVLLYALSEPKKPKLIATMAAIRQHMQRLPPAPPPPPAIRPQLVSHEEMSVLRRGPPGKRSETTALTDHEKQTIVLGDEEYFPPGSFVLSAKAKRTIQQDVAPELRGFHNRVEIIGHADASEGGTTDAWHLGFARANSVLRYLADECGIPEIRFRLISGGANEPRDPAKPSANRRVEIIMTGILVKNAERDR